MAILWADGFDDWTAGSGIAGEYEAYSVSGGTGPSAGNGRRGGAAFAITGYTDYVNKTLGGAFTELYVSVAVKCASFGAPGNLLGFINGGTFCLFIGATNDGSIIVWRGNFNTTEIGRTAPGTLSTNAWAHLQVRVVFSATTGIVQIRVNGSTTPALNLTNVNTGSTPASGVQLYSGLFGTVIHYDDFVISDTSGSAANGWPGDVRVDTYLPNANGDLSQMVGSDGNSTDNYALVNAATPGSSYVQSTTVGAEDLYQVADMSHTPTAILGVVVTAAALKDDAGTRAIRLHAKSGAVDARSDADIALATSRCRVATVFGTDPNTGAAWTRTAFNGARFGFEVTV